MLARGKIITMPCCYDPLTARITEAPFGGGGHLPGHVSSYCSARQICNGCRARPLLGLGAVLPAAGPAAALGEPGGALRGRGLRADVHDGLRGQRGAWLPGLPARLLPGLGASELQGRLGSLGSLCGRKLSGRPCIGAVRPESASSYPRLLTGPGTMANRSIVRERGSAPQRGRHSTITVCFHQMHLCSGSLMV